MAVFVFKETIYDGSSVRLLYIVLKYMYWTIMYKQYIIIMKMKLKSINIYFFYIFLYIIKCIYMGMGGGNAPRVTFHVISGGLQPPNILAL